jgi:glycosyltransferase involved in cell wall biosynthesis
VDLSRHRRVLFVVSYYKPAFVYGGPIHSISLLCEALARLDVQVTVVTTDANGAGRLDVPLNQAVDVNGVEVWYFPLSFGGAFYYSRALGAACKNLIPQFDIVVIECVLGYALFPAAKACINAEIPYVVPLRGQLLPWSLRQGSWKKDLYLKLLANRYLNQAAAIHCTDVDEAQFASALLAPPPFVVPNGIDTRHFTDLPSGNSLRSRLGIPPTANVLLFLGRLHPKKRPDIAIHALAACQSIQKDVHLVLAGPDESGMADQLRRLACHLGCEERLHIVGLLNGEEKLEALAAADLFLMPSEPESENFGMSALEALAAGVPILVSTGVPVGRWAAAAGAGQVVPCDAHSFGHAASELLEQPLKLQDMAQKGKQLAISTFDVSAVAQQMLAQYDAILERRRLDQTN